MKMNAKKTTGIVLVLAAAIGGAIFFLKNKNAADPNNGGGGNIPNTSGNAIQATYDPTLAPTDGGTGIQVIDNPVNLPQGSVPVNGLMN